MKMAGQYVFPDPDDRSKNDPSIIVSSKKVLGIYNQEHETEENMQNSSLTLKQKRFPLFSSANGISQSGIASFFLKSLSVFSTDRFVPPHTGINQSTIYTLPLLSVKTGFSGYPPL